MKTGGKRGLILLILVSVILLTVERSLPPSPLPENAPAAEFSAERALKHIRAFATRPRLTGTPGFEAARGYVLGELKELGLETDTQRIGALRNTLAWIEGTHPSSGIILFTAHLDSTAENPGASDDGTGVAVLLETARALAFTAPFRNTIAFLFTDYEEGGFFGARAFISNHPWAEDIKLVIGFDAGGPHGPGVLSATSPDNGWLIRQLVQADAYLVGSSALNALAYSSTDFGRAFKAAGFSGYAFDLYWNRFDLGWTSPIYHVPLDTLENVSLSSLQHQGYHALALARHLGMLGSLEDPKLPDAIYFTVLRLFTIVYPSIWSFPLAIAVTVLFFAVLTFGTGKRLLTYPGVAYGAFVMLVGVVIAPVPSFLWEKWLPGLIPFLTARSIDQPVVISLIVLSTLVLIFSWYYLACRIRSTSIFDLCIGALMPSLLGTLLISLIMPALSFILTWPLLLSLLACSSWLYAQTRQKESKIVLAGLLLCGGANCIIIVPTLVLGLFDQLPLTLLLVGVLCGFLAPLIHLILGSPLESMG